MKKKLTLSGYAIRRVNEKKSLRSITLNWLLKKGLDEMK